MIAEYLCRVVGHRRSARQAHVVEGKWRSRCKRCGAELIRVAPQDWEEYSDAA